MQTTPDDVNSQSNISTFILRGETTFYQIVTNVSLHIPNIINGETEEISTIHSKLLRKFSAMCDPAVASFVIKLSGKLQ